MINWRSCMKFKRHNWLKFILNLTKKGQRFIRDRKPKWMSFFQRFHLYLKTLTSNTGLMKSLIIVSLVLRLANGNSACIKILMAIKSWISTIKMAFISHIKSTKTPWRTRLWLSDILALTQMNMKSNGSCTTASQLIQNQSSWSGSMSTMRPRTRSTTRLTSALAWMERKRVSTLSRLSRRQTRPIWSRSSSLTISRRMERTNSLRCCVTMPPIRPTQCSTLASGARTSA